MIRGYIVKDEKLSLGFEIFESVMGRGTAPHVLDFESNAFAKRELIVAFDTDGSLLTVTRNTTSSAEALSGALAEGSQNLLTRYKTGLAELESELLLTNRTATLQLAAEQAKLAAQLVTLESKLSLQEAEAKFASEMSKALLDSQLLAFDARQNLERAKAKAAMDLEAERLKSQVKVLEERITLLRKEVEFRTEKKDEGK